MANLKIAGATLNQTPLDWENNLKNIREAIELAQKDGVELLCFPELCITGYGCEDNFLSTWVSQKALECLGEIKTWCSNITVVVGLPYIHQKTTYNTACVIQNKQLKAMYVKQNMALDGVHYEPRWFTPWQVGRIEEVEINGDVIPIGDITYELNGIKIGFEICEDAWRVDRPGYRLQKRGVQLILNPSASHFAMGKSIDRETLVVNSSKTFDCTYLYANLLGNEAGRMIYDGEILIAKEGALLLRNNWLSFENVIVQSIDIEFSKTPTRSLLKEFDRDKELEFVKASSLALFDYLRKSKSKGFVLSLSGGADSSTTALLVAEMVKRGVKALGTDAFISKIGLEKELSEALQMEQNEAVRYITGNILHCAYQSTVNSSKETRTAAQQLSKEIGATYSEWSIDKQVADYTSSMEAVLGRPMTWETDDIALQNIQARARSPIIWMLANVKNCLLLTTSNRSEGDVGYTTMDGDTSGSIAPIAAVDKHFIIHWLKWAQKHLEYKSLSYVNSLSPSAELRPLENTQTDEADLMPYAVIVEIERLAIRDKQSPLEVYNTLAAKNLESEKLLKAHITKFFRLWSRNQWKRERIAPAFHLDDFNVDPRTWCRFPILSSGFEAELKELNTN